MPLKTGDVVRIEGDDGEAVGTVVMVNHGNPPGYTFYVVRVTHAETGDGQQKEADDA